MAMRQRANDFHRLSGGQQFVTTQHRAELFNALGGPAGQVGEGSVLGLAGLAVTLTQQDGRWRASVGDDSHIHAPRESRWSRRVNGNQLYYMTALPTNIGSFRQLDSKSGQSSA